LTESTRIVITVCFTLLVSLIAWLVAAHERARLGADKSHAEWQELESLVNVLAGRLDVMSRDLHGIAKIDALASLRDEYSQLRHATTGRMDTVDENQRTLNLAFEQLTAQMKTQLTRVDEEITRASSIVTQSRAGTMRSA
jgi:hypothetical protein